MSDTNAPWWETLSLTEMSREQWESLCDQCAKCCLIKLEDEDDGTVYYTDVACDLLEGKTCRCTDYANREVLVPDCLRLTPDNLDQLYWMPPSCSYRLLHEGHPLPPWHHLITGDPNSIHEYGESVQGRFVYAARVKEEEWEEHVVEWPLLLSQSLNNA